MDVFVVGSNERSIRIFHCPFVLTVNETIEIASTPMAFIRGSVALGVPKRRIIKVAYLTYKMHLLTKPDRNLSIGSLTTVNMVQSSSSVLV